MSNWKPVVDFTKSCRSKISRKCEFQPIKSLEIILTINLRLTTSCEIDPRWAITGSLEPLVSVSVCIDRGLSALLWPGPILLIRRPWPYVIHHLHFMNMYRLYIAWYRPILLMYVGCINWYFRNKTLFLWLKSETILSFYRHRRLLPPFKYNGWYHPRTSTS